MTLMLTATYLSTASMGLYLGTVDLYVSRACTVLDINIWFSFLAFVYTIPIGMIQAITNQQVGLKCVFVVL
jgi:hypothetical protein